jgi:hypothetical protein
MFRESDVMKSQVRLFETVPSASRVKRVPALIFLRIS